MTAPVQAPRMAVMLPPEGLTMTQVMRRARQAEEAGADQIWVEQLPDQRDIGVVAAALATATSTAQIGTSILPIHFRHPVAMAQMAAAVDELSGGRFNLGLGLSHQFINEFQLGLTTGSPVRSMLEYTTIVRSLLREGKVQYEGRYFTGRTSYTAPRRPELPIYLAGLRPRMVRLAVEHGDGLLLWMCTAEFVRDHVVPGVRQACADLGRDPADFPILAMVQTCCSAKEEVRQWYRRNLAGYAMMPYYRRVLEASGVQDSLAKGRVDEALDALAILGDADHVRARLARYREAGCVPVPTLAFCDDEDFAATLEVIRDA